MILTKKLIRFVKNKNMMLILFIVLFLLMRLIILFNSPYLDFVIDTECYLGSIAKEIIDGPRFHILNYIKVDHYLGWLLVGIFIVPFFLLFGELATSIMLLSIFISLLTLILFYFFIKKFFNFKTAMLFILLYIFPMTFYTRNQFNTFSFFSLLDVIIMFIFYNIFFDNKKDIKHFLLFGFMCGFAAWFSFKSWFIIFTCLLFWFIFDKKFFLKKYFLIFFIGFLIGYSPGIYYNLTNNFSGIINPKMEQAVGSIVLNPNLFIKAGSRFLYSFIFIPTTFGFMDFGFLSWRFISYSYYLIFLFAFFVVFWRCRKSIFKLITGIIPIKKNNIPPNKIKKEVFILLYPIIFLIIHSFTNLDFKDHYILSLYPFMLLILSLFVSKLWNKKNLKILAIFFLVTLLLLGLIGNLCLISLNNPYNGNEVYEPYCYYSLAKEIGRKADTNSFTFLCSKFDLEYQKYCYITFTKQLVETKCNNNIRCYINNCNKLELEYRKYCYEGIGLLVYCKDEINLTEGLNICDSFDSDYKDYCYKGLCQKINSKIGIDIKQGIEICNEMKDICRDYCYDSLAINMEKVSREHPRIYPINATKKCIDLEKRLIISRNKTICFLNLINSSLNISPTTILG